MVTSNTETDIAVTYEDGDNTLDFVIGTLNQNTTGNAATATALETARTIGGTSFDGTANIVPATVTVADTTDTTSYVGLWESATGDLGPKSDAGLTYNAGTAALTATTFVGALTGDASGNAATATALETGRTINGTSFDGTANITVSVDSSEITSGAVDLAHMSSESVDEDNLYISNSGSDGQYLQKQSGDNGGLTWAAVSGGEGVIAETENTISTSYTITSGYNASSAGPVVIASGATVTISSGSVWVII
jgi:hypothetical protein